MRSCYHYNCFWPIRNKITRLPTPLSNYCNNSLAYYTWFDLHISISRIPASGRSSINRTSNTNNNGGHRTNTMSNVAPSIQPHLTLTKSLPNTNIVYLSAIFIFVAWNFFYLTWTVCYGDYGYFDVYLQIEYEIFLKPPIRTNSWTSIILSYIC